jgi:hypothetical protein
MGPAHYARMAASQYRAHRGGISTGRRASPPRVAGRGRSQLATAAAGKPLGRGAYEYAHDAGSAGGRQGPMAAATERTAADSAVRAAGRPLGGSGAVRRGGGTAGGARQVARGYFRSRDTKR